MSNNKFVTFNQSSKNPSCYNTDVGQEYICPQVGEGGLRAQQLGQWFSKERQGMSETECYNRGSNLGVHQLCQDRPQNGGGSARNRKQKGACCGSKQRGGGGKIPDVVGNVAPGGAAARAAVNPFETINPNSYDLAALGYDVKMPKQGLSREAMSFFGYGRLGCPWNPTCPCGADCPCGPSCTCGQENTETKTNLGDVTVDLDNSISGNTIKLRKDLNEGKHKLTGKTCNGKPDEEYICGWKCDEDEKGCPINIHACSGTNASQENYRILCKDKLRCGNGQVAETPNKCCQNCNFTTQRLLTNPSRQYGLYTQSEEVPSYYLDLTQEAIGNRAVLVKSNREQIPEILLCDTIQNEDKCYGCRQPCWNEKCI